MNKSEYTTMKRKRRHAKVRTKIIGSESRPRLAVFRSNKNIYAQIIDDSQSITLAQANDLKETKGTKQEKATAVGKAIAKAAIAKGIESVVFDRAGYLFAGRVKALAEGAREGGLKF